ncbi:MAG: hypothetical protein IPP33_00010 [Flavobacteriales bacterium]|nr:hypothetical protein [Flavobacteriales bacterium]
MKVVVDTNIVFSAVLNSNSRIALVLISGKRHFKFYSCGFLRTELLKHQAKLRKLAKLSESELVEVTAKVCANITFMDERALSSALVLRTEELMASNDLKDVPFVALAKNLKAKLWTGDKALTKGLLVSHPKLVLSTADLLARIESLEG